MDELPPFAPVIYPFEKQNPEELKVIDHEVVEVVRQWYPIIAHDLSLREDAFTIISGPPISKEGYETAGFYSEKHKTIFVASSYRRAVEYISTLAHEMRHAWQRAYNIPVTEDDADRYAHNFLIRCSLIPAYPFWIRYPFYFTLSSILMVLGWKAGHFLSSVSDLTIWYVNVVAIGLAICATIVGIPIMLGGERGVKAAHVHLLFAATLISFDYHLPRPPPSSFGEHCYCLVFLAHISVLFALFIPLLPFSRCGVPKPCIPKPSKYPTEIYLLPKDKPNTEYRLEPTFKNGFLLLMVKALPWVFTIIITILIVLILRRMGI